MASIASVAVSSQPDPNAYVSLTPKMSKVGPNYGALIVSQTMELNLQITRGEVPGVGTYIDKFA